ncbi:uncharacterized protein LOC129722150 isoform X3 [Wyeomyia smithii]|uniref:uncharacterized protein LOC129722150 isoform X3 n=1 Tax=Wyeomyia smithii TaxID=174621 RepID=UPI002467AC6D|nr:uncharacterized protein LOC129722150 isoform X3 [Wyeomyia smithii]
MNSGLEREGFSELFALVSDFSSEHSVIAATLNRGMVQFHTVPCCAKSSVKIICGSSMVHQGASSAFLHCLYVPQNIKCRKKICRSRKLVNNAYRMLPKPSEAAASDSSGHNAPVVDSLSLSMIVLVALFWGATNPFIRRGSLGYNNLKSPTKLGQLWLELCFLLSRWQYLLPLALNQFGSVIYVFALQRSELSLVVPMANSLTFVFTAITARLLGEQVNNFLQKRTLECY